MVGVNDFTDGNADFTLFPEKGGRGVAAERITPAEERRQVARVRQWRRERDAEKSGAALARLERATEAGENVLPHVLSSVVAGATLGEVADVWRALFGEHKPSRAF